MKAVVTSPLHNNGHNSNMDSRATTTIGRGSGDGVTGDVEVDVGMLQTRRCLNFIGNDCDAGCDSRPKIELSGDDFRSKVSECIADADACPEKVQIGCWNTSEVTDMSFAFYETDFDDSINCWNTAHVTGMNNMFGKASNFNQPVNDWNVSRVTSMYYMFRLTNFNQPLNDWNVASVKDMREMFRLANFNQPLKDWNVASKAVRLKRELDGMASVHSTWSLVTSNLKKKTTSFFARACLFHFICKKNRKKAGARTIQPSNA